MKFFFKRCRRVPSSKYLIPLLFVFQMSGAAFAQKIISCELLKDDYVRVELHMSTKHSGGQVMPPSDGLGYQAVYGGLIDNYNGAALACPRNGWNLLTQYEIPMTCVGVWNHAFDGPRAVFDRVIKFKLEKSGSVYSASYKRNYDSRGNAQDDFEKVILKCREL